MEDTEIKELIQYEPRWNEELNLYLNKIKQFSVQDAIPDTVDFNKDIITFTEDEKEILMRLPNKTYLVQNDRKCLLNLVDIIYAYAYDYRITTGEHNVESAWTIGTISSTLAWFESFESIKDIIIACFRRSICYPLYRNFNLVKQVLKDTITIFRLGKRSILKCLLQIKKNT